MKRLSDPDTGTPIRPIESANPVYHNGILLVGTSTGTMSVLRADSGEVLWEFTSGGPIESEPIFHEGVVYFGNSQGTFYALRADTGRAVWSFQAGGVIFSRPLVLGDKIYIFNSEDRLFALQINGGGVVWVRNLRDEEASPKNVVYGSSSPVFYEGTIFVGTSQGLVAGVSPAGEVIWKSILVENGDYRDIDAEILGAKGVLIVPAPEAYSYGILPENGQNKWRIEATGEENGVFDDMGRICLPLVKKTVDRGEVLEVSCLDPESGKIEWNSENIKNIDKNREYGWTPTKPLIIGDKLILGLSGLGMAIIERKSGKISGFFPVSSGISANPARGDRGEIYVLSNDGYLYCLLIK